MKSLRNDLVNLFQLTKPRICFLLSVTGVCGLFATGEASLPGLLSFVVSLVGMVTGSAVMNQWYEQSLDRRMHRTRNRPLPQGEISSRQAFLFGLALFLGATVNAFLFLPLLTQVWLWLGIFCYLIVYTILLKPRHWSAVVVGGSAGSFPVLAGWSVAKPLSMEPILMALLVFAWTPAHAWALAYVYREDYRRGQIPVLPVIVGDGKLHRSIWISVLSTLCLGGALIPWRSWFYGLILVTGGALYLITFLEFSYYRTKAHAVLAFFTTNFFLGLLFIGWGMDEFIPSINPVLLSITVTSVLFLFVGMLTVRPSLNQIPSAPLLRTSDA